MSGDATVRTIREIPDGSDAQLGAMLAGDYHGGMGTALYALASSGSLERFPKEGFTSLIAELSEAIRIAKAAESEDALALVALATWLHAEMMRNGDTLLRTVWIAPCDTCGAEIMTDQFTGAPYFASGCECGGWPLEAGIYEDQEIVW
jgi:hypothetical protein